MFPVGGAFFLQEKTDFQATAASGRVGCVCGEGGATTLSRCLWWIWWG